jgi:hypothetical protein
MSNTPLCMHTTFFDPFICCRAPVLFPQLGYCEYCCDEHWCTSVSIVSGLTFLWVDARSGITWPYVSFTLAFWGISILLSIMVVLISVPSNIV